jgi:hypothetical protein
MPGDQRQNHDSEEPRDERPGAIPNATKQIMGPLLAGFAIDAIDLITFGPVGIYTGLIVGGVVGYFLAPYLGFPQRKWWVSSLLTGVYCTLPLTAFVPAATFAAVVTTLISKQTVEPSSDNDATLSKEGSIEVDYEVIDDDPDRP